MIVIGIDPGSSTGAIAALHLGRSADEVADLPVAGVKAKARIDVHALADWIRSHKPGHCFIERAQAFPGQGASSGFKYGRATGAVEATVMMCGVPLTIIEVSAWKKHYRLKGGDKESARALAIQLHPHLASSLARKLDHGRAEAILIAHFGLSMLGVAPGYRAAA